MLSRRRRGVRVSRICLIGRGEKKKEVCLFSGWGEVYVDASAVGAVSVMNVMR